MRSFLLALQFLTVFRISQNVADFLSGLRWFFAVGFLVGLLQWTFCRIALEFRFPIDVLAPLLVIAGVLVTGGLHLDGVADMADGFGAGNDRESVLRIMKDNRTGVYGIAAIVFSLYLKILAFGYAVKWETLSVILIAPMLSRGLLAATCTILPYARSEGTAKVFSGGSFFKHALPGVILSAIITLYLLRFPHGLYLFSLAVFLAFLFSLYCYSKIKGYTGDTLGAQNEFSEIMLLLAGGMLL